MTSQPNILFIFSDQQRHDTIGAYGNPDGITPNLDKMATDGTRFEYAFTPQPLCGPARSCLQTGRYPTAIGCYKNGIPLPENEKTIAHYCGEKGYELAYIGKWHLASGKTPDGEVRKYGTKAVPEKYRGGWKDYWLAADTLEFTSTSSGGYLYDTEGKKVDFGGYRADSMTDFALDFLKNKLTGDKPFFLFLSYLEPHHQNTTFRYEGPPGSKEKFADYTVPEDLKGKFGDWKKSYPDYLGCCHSLDYNVGRIRDELEAQGLDENTIIIYTSDHGSHFRTRNSEYKRSPHENSIRIPMIISGPGFEGGKVKEDLVSLIDLPPTILKAAGASIPENMDGLPLQNLLGHEKSTDWPKERLIQVSESSVARALRSRKWKYSVSAPDKSGVLYSGSDVYIEDSLYDLENDPHEKNNLVKSSQYRDIRTEMNGKLSKLMIEAGEMKPEILTRTGMNLLKARLQIPLRNLKKLI